MWGQFISNLHFAPNFLRIHIMFFFVVELDLKYYSNLAATLIHHLGQFRLILYWVTKIWCQKNKINTTRLWSSEALKSVLITAKKIRRKRKKSLNGFWSPAAIHTSLFFYCTDLGMIIIPKINKDYHPLVIKKFSISAFLVNYKSTLEFSTAKFYLI